MDDLILSPIVHNYRHDKDKKFVLCIINLAPHEILWGLKQRKHLLSTRFILNPTVIYSVEMGYTTLGYTPILLLCWCLCAYAQTTKANFSDILDLCLQIIFTLTTYSKWKFFYISLYTFPFVKKTFGTF